jgi:RNAse (barnase) inhibitor barstar
MTQLTTKDFVIEGRNIKSVEEFWDEVQNILASGFSFFGRNLDAFKDILCGGFGPFEEDEQIRLKFIHRNYAK